MCGITALKQRPPNLPLLSPAKSYNAPNVAPALRSPLRASPLRAAQYAARGAFILGIIRVRHNRASLSQREPNTPARARSLRVNTSLNGGNRFRLRAFSGIAAFRTRRSNRALPPLRNELRYLRLRQSHH